MVKISRLLILKCFKGNGSNFIIDPRRNGKPVKGTKNRSNGVETTGRWNDYTSKRVFDKLEAMDGMKRETKEKRIAVVRSSHRYHHVPETFIQIFNSIYSDFGVTVSSRGQLTDMILVRRGVLQGDPCSPLLFNICFNSLMRLLESPGYKMGYFWGK